MNNIFDVIASASVESDKCSICKDEDCYVKLVKTVNYKLGKRIVESIALCKEHSALSKFIMQGDPEFEIIYLDLCIESLKRTVAPEDLNKDNLSNDYLECYLSG